MGPGWSFKEPSLAELARVIKAGACIEASFKRGKSEAGMDDVSGADLAGLASPHGVVFDGGVVLDR